MNRLDLLIYSLEQDMKDLKIKKKDLYSILHRNTVSTLFKLHVGSLESLHKIIDYIDKIKEDKEDIDFFEKSNFYKSPKEMFKAKIIKSEANMILYKEKAEKAHSEEKFDEYIMFSEKAEEAEKEAKRNISLYNKYKTTTWESFKKEKL